MDQVTAISQYAKINVNTKNPSQVTFYHLGGQTFTLSQYTEVHATVYAPGAEVRLSQEAQLFGRVLAERVELLQGGQIHIDKKLVQPLYACGNLVSDTPGSYSGAHNGAVSSLNTFRQWFRNVPGVNVSEVQRLHMDGDGSGNFETTHDDFNIADGRLMSSGTTDKNKYFTYEMVAVGQYNMCGEQFFEFAGAGDVYVMINDMLVIDLGGDSPSKNQIVELDRMGMADGELYTFRFFYAQRNGDTSQPFSIKTNMNFVFSDAEMPDSSGMYD
jgi:fibro-slime domain-containing protein